MTDNPQLFNRHGGYITEGKYDMRRLAAFLFLDVRKAHWCPAVDLVNGGESPAYAGNFEVAGSVP